MTLAIAWRSEGRIHLASDSRIKLGQGQFADIGIKVLGLPIIVSDTRGTAPGISIIFQSTYGFGYAGSLVNAGTFAELMGELLQHVQFLQETQKFSFVAVCDFVVEYCSQITTAVCSFMLQHGSYEFFLTGLCPQTQSIRAAHFQFEHSPLTAQAQAKYQEILKADGEFVAIGTGAAAAEKRIKEVGLKPILLAINEVIDSKEVDSVGGDLQYGSFDKSARFVVSGFIRRSFEKLEHEGTPYGPQEQRIFRYRGFQMYDGWDPLAKALWATPSFIEIDVPSNEDSVKHFRRRLGLPNL